MPGLFGGSSSPSVPAPGPEELALRQAQTRALEQGTNLTEQLLLPVALQQMGWTADTAISQTPQPNPEYQKALDVVSQLQTKYDNLLRQANQPDLTGYQRNIRENEANTIRNQLIKAQTVLIQTPETIGTVPSTTPQYRQMTQAELEAQNPQLAADRARAAERSALEQRLLGEYQKALTAAKEYEDITRPQISQIADNLKLLEGQYGTLGTQATEYIGDITGKIGTAAGKLGTLYDYNQPVLDVSRQLYLNELQGQVPGYLQQQLDLQRKIRTEDLIRRGINPWESPTGVAAEAEFNRLQNLAVQQEMLNRIAQAGNNYYTGFNTTANLLPVQANLYGQQGTLYGQNANFLANLYGQQANLGTTRAGLIRSNMPGQYLLTAQTAPNYQPYAQNYTSTAASIPNAYTGLTTGYNQAILPYQQDRQYAYQSALNEYERQQQGAQGLLGTLTRAGIGYALGGPATGATMWDRLGGAGLAIIGMDPRGRR